MEYYAAVGEEEKEIRHAFEAEVGEGVLKHTRHLKSDIAKWLWKWAQHGVLVDEWNLADEVTKEWLTSRSDDDGEDDNVTGGESDAREGEGSDGDESEVPDFHDSMR
jgi:hypothetical protein